MHQSIEDMNDCKELRTIIDGYIMRYQPEVFELDLSKVEFMDSSGIGLIIDRYNLIKMLGVKFILVNPTESIKRVIELSKIGKNILMRCG